MSMGGHPAEYLLKIGLRPARLRMGDVPVVKQGDVERGRQAVFSFPGRPGPPQIQKGGSTDARDRAASPTDTPEALGVAEEFPCRACYHGAGLAHNCRPSFGAVLPTRRVHRASRHRCVPCLSRVLPIECPRALVDPLVHGSSGRAPCGPRLRGAVARELGGSGGADPKALRREYPRSADRGPRRALDGRLPWPLPAGGRRGTAGSASAPCARSGGGGQGGRPPRPLGGSIGHAGTRGFPVESRSPDQILPAFR
jgi:hypothetical protein